MLKDFRRIWRIRLLLGRYLQGGNSIGEFAIDAQHLTTGCEDGYPRAARQNGLYEVCGRVDDVFTIIENEEQSAVSDRARNGCCGDGVSMQFQAEGTGDR